MESDETGFLGGGEMAGDCVADHCFELVQRIRFGEDGKTERPGMVATFREFLDGKDDFALGHVLGPWSIIRCVEIEIRTLCTNVKGEDPDAKPTLGAPGKERPARKTDVWATRH